MQEHRDRYEEESGSQEDLERLELLKTVAHLKQDVRSMTDDIRAVLSENEKLKREVNSLRGGSRPDRGFGDVHRMKSEIDELIRMHEAASMGRNRVQSSTRRPSYPVAAPDPSSQWMKKMMMFMMINELVSE